MNTTNVGREAEERVASLLRAKGHTIVAMNWRTRWCEIDIVSKTKHCVFFTEVKYRTSNTWGSGFDYITPLKMRQMEFAAQFWLSENSWVGEAQLQAAAVSADGAIELVGL